MFPINICFQVPLLIPSDRFTRSEGRDHRHLLRRLHNRTQPAETHHQRIVHETAFDTLLLTNLSSGRNEQPEVETRYQDGQPTFDAVFALRFLDLTEGVTRHECSEDAQTDVAETSEEFI